VTSPTKSQRQRILDLLLGAHGQEVPSVALSRISLQYGARVKELRATGYRISNRTERCAGKVYGYFRLESRPIEEPNGSVGPAYARPEMSSFPEFGSLAPERYGVD